MILIDGKLVSKQRLDRLKSEIEKSKLKPGLAVIRVGDDEASRVYVTKKIKTCAEMGFLSEEHHLSASASMDAVLSKINELNKRPEIHGILLQLPLPKQLDETHLLEAIHPLKDVDGFHPTNRGRLMAKQRTFVPCTPLGIMSLLDHYKIPLKGKKAVVIGRSLIVGRPMSLLLDHGGATVTVVHSQTTQPEDFLADADLVVVAVGKTHHLQKQKLKNGVVLIDVGINRLPTGKLAGDIDFESYKNIASAMTPVPGGVGPMTICSLLENTWQAAQNFSIDTRK